MKFLSPEVEAPIFLEAVLAIKLSPMVDLSLINLPYAHVWNTVVTSVLGPQLLLLDKLQKCICRIVGPYLLLLLNPWLIVEMWPA